MSPVMSWTLITSKPGSTVPEILENFRVPRHSLLWLEPKALIAEQRHERVPGVNPAIFKERQGCFSGGTLSRTLITGSGSSRPGRKRQESRRLDPSIPIGWIPAMASLGIWESEGPQLPAAYRSRKQGCAHSARLRVSCRTMKFRQNDRLARSQFSLRRDAEVRPPESSIRFP